MIITAINWSNNFHFNTKISRIYDRILVFGYHWNLIGTAKLLTTENIFSITYNFTKHPWILWPNPINFERHSCWKEVHTPSLNLKKDWTKFFPYFAIYQLVVIKKFDRQNWLVFKKRRSFFFQIRLKFLHLHSQVDFHIESTKARRAIQWYML